LRVGFATSAFGARQLRAKTRVGTGEGDQMAQIRAFESDLPLTVRGKKSHSLSFRRACWRTGRPLKKRGA